MITCIRVDCVGASKELFLRLLVLSAWICLSSDLDFDKPPVSQPCFHYDSLSSCNAFASKITEADKINQREIS